MRKRIQCFVVMALLAGAALAAAEEGGEGRELMEGARKTQGGAEAYGAVTATRSRFTVTASIRGTDITLQTTALYIFPDRQHKQVKTPFGTQSMTVADGRGWARTPAGIREVDPEKVAHELRLMNLGYVGVFRNLEGLNLEALEPQIVEGAICRVVRVADGQDGSATYYLSAKDYTPVMIETAAESPLTRAPATLQMHIDEYMTVEGIRVPRVARMSFDGELFGTATVDEFEVNPTVDESLFAR